MRHFAQSVQFVLNKLHVPARVTGLSLSLIVLSACATGITPRAPTLAMPPTYDAADQQALPPASLDAWWQLYDDPQLSALIEDAFESGLDARLALARLDEAQAIRDSALTRFNPQGGLQGSAENRRTENLDDDRGDAGVPGLPSAAGSNRSASLNFLVSWELDLFGRRAAARRAADADLAGARFEYEAARASLAANVARGLFQARSLAIQLEDARENQRIQGELLSLLQRRVALGLAAASVADRVSADLAQADARSVSLEGELQVARRAVLALLGQGLQPVAALPVTAELPEVPAVPTTLPAELLQRRPDVRRSLARIEASAGTLRLAELEFFPRLTLQPGVGLSAQRGSFDSTTSFWSIGLGLAVPVLDRPRLAAAVRAESARGQQAVIGYERDVQTAFIEADRALLRLQVDRARSARLDEGERAARRAFDAARKRFSLGISDLQTLLDAERVWRGVRSELNAARTDALLGSVDSFQALGGGWTVDSLPNPLSDVDPDHDD